MTFEAFAADVLERLRADMQSVRHPHGDVHPAVFALEDGEIRRLKIPRAMYNNRASKDLLTTLIARTARAAGTRMLAIEQTVYLTAIDASTLSAEQLEAFARNELPEGFVQPSQNPERIEALQVIALASEQTAVWTATIERDGRNPPVYGDWVRGIDNVPHGLMIDPLREAMRS